MCQRVIFFAQFSLAQGYCHEIPGEDERMDLRDEVDNVTHARSPKEK